jgi:hypothetical protein
MPNGGALTLRTGIGQEQEKYGTLLCAASSISPSAGLSDPYHFAYRELGPVPMDEFALKFFALLSGLGQLCRTTLPSWRDLTMFAVLLCIYL